MRSFRASLWLVLCGWGLGVVPIRGAAAQTLPVDAGARAAAVAATRYLALEMDRYHDRFWVYEDVSSPGNHFHAWALIPDASAAVAINGSWAENPHSGATSIRCLFTNTTAPNYGGYYFQNGVLQGAAMEPVPNFGTVPNAGIDLTGAQQLTFWARGKRGGERVEFFCGGVGRNANSGRPEQPFPDSAPVTRISVRLTTQWKQYRINLRRRNLRYVLGGFGWVCGDKKNRGGAEFFVDDIQYTLDPAARSRRLSQPRFIRSFRTLPVQPDLHDENPQDDLDFVLRNTAFVYDNALALLAFLAEGSADSLRRGRLIGDAFVYASQHDRHFTDGRLRTAYAAGDLALPPGWTPNGIAGTAAVPGFYDEANAAFREVEQNAVDVGNNAWVMIALLALSQRTGAPAYRTVAEQLGRFVATFRINTGTYRGFLGGVTDPETAAPQLRPYASTEHNLDLIAAFTVLAQQTGDTRWLDEAAHARAFVEAMWDAERGCYLTGTVDPEQRNPSPVPLDTQSWAVLALPDALQLHPQLLACVEQFHRTTHHGFTGYDFNDDRDGVWFEGTGQMAVAYARAQNADRVGELRQELQRAQQTAPFGEEGGIAAACHDGVSTGFSFQLYRRLHLGAAAWNVFAQLGFNPYYQQLH